MKQIVLASASPRRRELLHYITDDFICAVSEADESGLTLPAPALVCALAERKAREVLARYPDAVVIGADTVVEVDGKVLGKPKDRAEARRFMQMLSGTTHFVHTGVCVTDADQTCTRAAKTAVHFLALDAQETEAYLDTDECWDKAGGYAIQGTAAKWIDRIEGCYYNVMGLPVSLVNTMLKKFF